MSKMWKFGSAATLFVLLLLSFGPTRLPAQDGKAMGGVTFDGDTQLDRDSGIWIDGDYVGYVKEFRGKKNVPLLPGKHHIVVKQKGYQDLTRDIDIQPGQIQSIEVSMQMIPGATVPDVTAELKISAQPKRAAVYLDGSYIGPASQLGGHFHSLLVGPGKHKIKIELPGYQTFETEIDVVAGQKAQVKTELIKSDTGQNAPDTKKPQ
ncbi:MAG: PEGA domain-containing protein [Candidatus Acidiferrum sp.]